MGAPPRPHPDLAFVRRVLVHEPDAVRSFVERMRLVPRALAARNRDRGRPLGDDELQDLAQDVTLAVWRKLGQYDGRAALDTWVFRFCALEFLACLRGVRRRPVGGEPPEGEAPPPELPAALEFEHVHRALEALSPEEAHVVRLKHFDGLSFEEIATREQLSPNTAKTRYYRGLQKLRERLGSPTDRKREDREGFFT